MEGMGYINHDSMKAGARYDVVGELRFNQKEPLPHRGTYNKYNVSNERRFLLVSVKTWHNI
jgi:hypothetical protein